MVSPHFALLLKNLRTLFFVVLWVRNIFLTKFWTLMGFGSLSDVKLGEVGILMNFSHLKHILNTFYIICLELLLHS